MRFTPIFFICFFIVDGCTRQNPSFNPSDSFISPGIDVGIGDDLSQIDDGDDPRKDLQADHYSIGDLQPRPDTVPWKCFEDKQCNDKIPCTKDWCNKATNTCRNELYSSYCLINKACHFNGWTGSNPCLVCDTSKSTTSWSVKPDDTLCSPDGFFCTDNICKKGVCTHPVVRGCLIAGKCYWENQSPQNNPCEECIPAHNTTGWTFVSGKPCPSSNSSVAKMCVVNKCAAWREGTYEPKSTTETDVMTTTLTAVDFIPASQAVWATASYTTSSGIPRGAIVQLTDTSSTTVAPTLSKNPLYNLHHRLAVGSDGTAYYYDGKKWVISSSYKSEVEATRYAVWGTSIAGREVYYLGGYQSSGGYKGGASNAGIKRCIRNPIGGQFSCSNHSGIATNTLVGALFGTLESDGSQGRLWAASLEHYSGTDSQDIYSNSGSGNTWSRNPIYGCQEMTASSTPCSNTPGGFLNMHGSSATDVWVVGRGGTLLRFTNKGWTRIDNKLTNQSSYDLTAVYSSSKEGLVTFAAQAAGNSDSVVIYNFNTKLNRVFEPISISQGGYITDIGGKDYSDLWMVGQRAYKGWYLHLDLH